ncbi:MAG: hypothetical protein V5A30_01985 [Haloarculaceae archaeon]
MKENDAPGDDVTRRPDTERSRPLGDGDEEATDTGRSVSTRRRSVLKTLSLPPLAMALAGCPDDNDPFAPEAPGTGGPPEDLSAGATLAFEEAVRGGRSYELSVSVGAGEGQTTLTGRVDGNDQYVRTEQGATATETYLVDGQGYLVTGDRCVRYEVGDGGGRPPGGADGEDSASMDLRLVERTTVDGRETYRFEPTGERMTATRTAGNESRAAAATDAAASGTTAPATGTGEPETTAATPAGDGGQPTYYVDVETGYLRRTETGTAVVEYGSWGSVQPVTPPDRECQPRESGDGPGVGTATRTATGTETRTGAVTPTPTRTEPAGTPGEWEADRTREYAVEDRTGVRIPVSDRQTTLVQFSAPFPVDIYTVPVDVAADFPGEAALSRSVDALTATGRPTGRLLGTLEGDDHVVFIDNTAEVGVGPPSPDAVAEVSLRVAFGR